MNNSVSLQNKACPVLAWPLRYLHNTLIFWVMKQKPVYISANKFILQISVAQKEGAVVLAGIVNFLHSILYGAVF